MTTPKFSRRRFIKTALISLLMGGCTSPKLPESTVPAPVSVFSPKPTTTPMPTITTTPPPSADGVVQSYLEAWKQGNLETMYNLISSTSRRLTPKTQFYSLYQHTWEQMTALSLETQVQSLLADGGQATATFKSKWQTSLFDSIERVNTMSLKFNNGKWEVDWEPTLILPELGHGVTLNLLEETVPRGNIFDGADQLLASHGQAITLGVVPALIEDERALIEKLSLITRIKPAIIQEKIDQAQANWFVPIADINFEVNVEYHEELVALAGIERRPHPIRVYHHGESAGHIIGMLGGIPAEKVASYHLEGYRGDELIGISGIEGWGELFLAGKRGGQLATFSPTRKKLAEIATVKAKPGGNIYLSLDINLQKQAEDILGNQRGTIVVMEPTGFIKVMASYPRFAPALFATGIKSKTWNELLNNEERPLVNRVTQGTYPPASVFKIVGIAAALEKLGYDANKTFTCTGYWEGLGPNFPKKCWKEEGHGSISLVDGLTQSCDVVFYEIGLALHKQNPNLLPEMARSFGFGTETGILGLDETTGLVPDNAWKQAALNEAFFDGDAVNMIIGQGNMLATPLQIAHMMAALSTNGQRYQPQIVRHISSQNSGDQPFAPKIVGSLPVSAENLAIIQEALLAVVHKKSGTARAAFEGIEYTVVGKTGTAETGKDDPHAWFAGYAPAREPQIVIVVLVENGGEGSDKAAPLFRQMVEAYFAWTQQ